MTLLAGNLGATSFDMVFASERVHYSLAGVIFDGWKQFQIIEGLYSEVIRDLQGNIIAGAIEVIPPAIVAPTYNNFGFIRLLTTGATQILTDVHSFSFIITGTAEVNGNLLDNKEAVQLTATTTFPSITITALTGTVIGNYTF